MSAALALAFLENVTAQRDADGVSQSFDTTALSRLHSIEVPAPGRLTAVLPITPEVQNRYGTLHGGCIATLVDTVGSAALVTVSPKGGVSLNINVTYLSKAALGSSVLVDAQVVKVGRSIATIDVRLLEEGSGVLVAQGTHVKFIASQEPTMEAIMQANQENGGGAGGEEQRQAAREPAAVGPRSKL